jgi:hypothetical protein
MLASDDDNDPQLYGPTSQNWVRPAASSMDRAL